MTGKESILGRRPACAKARRLEEHGACGETGRGEFGACSEGSGSNEAPMGILIDSE